MFALLSFATEPFASSVCLLTEFFQQDNTEENPNQDITLVPYLW